MGVCGFCAVIDFCICLYRHNIRLGSSNTCNGGLKRCMSVFFTRFCSGSFFPLLLFSLPLLFCLFPALIDVFFFLKIHICMKFFFIVISSLLGGMVGEVHNGIKTVQNSTSCFLAGLWCWLVG